MSVLSPAEARSRPRPRLSLKNSLEARDEAAKPGTADDENIAVLCPGAGDATCEGKPDEQELVHFYLMRRYKL